MKINFVKLTALLALVSAFVLEGCASPFISPKAGDAVPEGKGVVRVTLGSSPRVTRGDPGKRLRSGRGR
jgi:hypothetical protein